MNLSLKTAPSIEPVTLVEAKLHLRVDHTDDDTLITSKIAAARQYVEQVTLHRALLTQTWELRLDAWPCSPLKLPYPPLQSIVAITYKIEDGTVMTVDPSVYDIDTAGTPGRLFLKPNQSWPSAALYPYNAIGIQIIAGWATTSDVPAVIKAGILLLVGHLYENREQEIVASGLSPVSLALGLDHLMADWRVWSF